MTFIVYTSDGESPGFLASSGRLLHLGWWSTPMPSATPPLSSRLALRMQCIIIYLEVMRFDDLGQQINISSSSRSVTTSLSKSPHTNDLVSKVFLDILPEKGTDCNFGQINLTMDSDTVHALCYFT
jgi:hypothetical protein